jgi:pimeloyl-ACP methyl ester carboxylesterase
MNIDMGFRNLVRPRSVTTPLLILEGEQVSWGRQVARDIARAYRLEAHYLPDMGHNMMLESRWRDVADRIREWLATKDL